MRASLIADKIPCMETFRDRISRRLKEKGKSLRKASLESGLSAEAVGKILKLLDNSPTLETITKLAVGLETSPQWIAFGIGSHDAASDHNSQTCTAVANNEEIISTSYALRPECAAFAERLKSSRQQAGFKSLSKASRAAELEENDYKSLEAGRKAIPEFAEVRKLANTFRVPFIWLLTGEGDLPVWLRAKSNNDFETLSSASIQAKRSGKNRLPDNAYIQAEIGVLRELVAGAVQYLDISEEEANIFSDAVIELIGERSTSSVVLQLSERSHTVLGSPMLKTDDLR